MANHETSAGAPGAAHEPLPAGLVEALGHAAAYPLDPDAARGIEHIQTHLSHVFLLAEHVYKLHKAVDLGFVCFSARAQRNRDSLDEVRLNRRLAADVYLGISPILTTEDGFRVGPVAREPDTLDHALEHCVVMRRLEADRDALSLLERGELRPAQLDAVAEKIARFHRTLAPVTETSAGDVAAPAQANLAAIEGAGEAVVPRVDAVALREAIESAIAAAKPDLDRRRSEGRVVEGHGDLHLQHVWLPSDPDLQADPPIIDCLEFSAALRVIDVAAEVAFLAMDLAYRGAGDLAEAFLRHYVLETDDYDLYSVVDLFVSHRAAVRGKVAALAAADAGIDLAQREGAAQSAQRHVALALRALEARSPGDVILVGGVIGTGKSTVAQAIARTTHAVIVSSDRVRKAGLGLAATDRIEDGVDEGVYAPASREKVYADMLARAESVIASGRSVVLDATWSSAALRNRARAFAAERGARCVFLETCCDPSVLRERLAVRKARGDDASDAGPELLDESLARFEALGGDDTWPETERMRIHTDRDDLDAAIAKAVEALDLGAVTAWD